MLSSAVVFSLLVFLGSFILLNLVLAVISDSVNRLDMEQVEKAKRCVLRTHTLLGLKV